MDIQPISETVNLKDGEFIIGVTVISDSQFVYTIIGIITGILTKSGIVRKQNITLKTDSLRDTLLNKYKSAQIFDVLVPNLCVINFITVSSVAATSTFNGMMLGYINIATLESGFTGVNLGYYPPEVLNYKSENSDIYRYIMYTYNSNYEFRIVGSGQQKLELILTPTDRQNILSALESINNPNLPIISIVQPYQTYIKLILVVLVFVAIIVISIIRRRNNSTININRNYRETPIVI